MLKKRALQRNRIALFLAVILIFCAFGTNAILASGHPGISQRAGGYEHETALEHPGAGEFFANSLPHSEQQSVRELSADWQGFICLRPGRDHGTKSGPRAVQVCVAAPGGLLSTTSCSDSSGADDEMPALRCSEIIVCYIHNQDGAKG